VDERFLPLATYIRAARTSAAAAAAGTDVPAVTPPAAAPLPSVVPHVVDFAHADIVHDLTMMRLAAGEAFEGAMRRLIADLAHEVLGRELALAPADIEALVARALAAWTQHEPVALVVGPADRDRVRAPLPVRTDATLAAGDLIVYVRDGAFESSFGFRLEGAIERAARGAA